MRTSIKPLLYKNSNSLLSFGEQYLKEMGFAKPRQEAEEILATLLSVRRIDLYLDSNRLVSNEDNSAFVDKIIRRGRHEPLQYITGRVDFCGLPFSVSPGVFIPRPETELIVEEINQLKINSQSILDLCTGSGALAIALAKRFPLASITAIDCSKLALDTARLNQQRHHAYQITFLEGDLFSPLTPQKDIYDLIVCNPPYIAEEDWQTMDPEVLEYEPPLALFSEDCGLAHLKSVLRKAPPFLSPLGVLILEIGMGQSVRLIDFVKNNTPLKASVVKDFAGIDRILICQSSNASPSRGG